MKKILLGIILLNTLLFGNERIAIEGNIITLETGEVINIFNIKDVIT